MLYRKYGMHASNSIYAENPSLHKASSHSFIDRPINCWHIKQHKECIGHHKKIVFLTITYTMKKQATKSVYYLRSAYVW